MSIQIRVLGTAGGDNAVFLQVDSGQTVERLLFDCGEGCVDRLSSGDIQSIDHLFFSHLHMDHVAGFDAFFRCTFNRLTKPNWIWGPPETAAIMQHRFQGYLWNLHEQMSATWHVAEVAPEQILVRRFDANESFSVAHDAPVQPRATSLICEGTGYTVEAITMDHRTPSLAYLVREKPRLNVDTRRMEMLGLRPGPWIKDLKNIGAETITIDGVVCSLSELREKLLVETPGSSVAYLTDFLLDSRAMDRLSAFLPPCRTVICEAQYRHSDLQLAERNYHMTANQAATLANRIGCEELILFHISERYERPAWQEMLEEARQIFPATRFPETWEIGPQIG